MSVVARTFALGCLVSLKANGLQQAITEDYVTPETALALLQHEAVRIHAEPGKHRTAQLLNERSRKPTKHKQAEVDAGAHIHVADTSESLEGAVQKKDTMWFIGDNGKVQESGPSAEEAAAVAADPDEILPIYPAPMKSLRTDPVHFHLPQGAVDMVTRLSEVVISVTHENTEAEWALAGSNSKAANDQKVASSMLADIENDEKFTVMDIADIAELAAESQSAESAAANGVLIKASHIAMLAHGFRGEDYGANYNFDTDNPAKQTFQGDIMKEMSTKPWTDGIVKYCVAPDVTPRIQHLVGKAMEHYTRAVPFIQFEDVGHASGKSDSIRDDQKCKSSPAIFVTSSDDYGCFAHRGMLAKDSQSLQLNDPGCGLIGTVIHMLGHSLGLGHEHFAKGTNVMKNQVKHGRGKNFEFEDTPGEPESHNALSVMHYDPYAFAEDPRKPTLTGPGMSVMGQRMGLAKSDVDKLVELYSTEGDAESALNGIGCINNPLHKCPALSSKMPFCRSDDFSHCCGCGGGTKIQCYKNLEDEDGGDAKCPRAQAVSYLSVMRVAFLSSIILVPLFAWCIFGASAVAKTDAKHHASPRSPKKASPRDGRTKPAPSGEGPSTASEPGDEDNNTPSSSAAYAGGEDMKKNLLAPLPPKKVGTGERFLASLGFGGSAPVSEGLMAQDDRTPASKLSTEAFERFQGDFTPMGGGFSTGREWAPPDVLVSGATAAPNGSAATGSMEAVAEEPSSPNSGPGAASSSTA